VITPRRAVPRSQDSHSGWPRGSPRGPPLDPPRPNSDRGSAGGRSIARLPTKSRKMIAPTLGITTTTPPSSTMTGACRIPPIAWDAVSSVPNSYSNRDQTISLTRRALTRRTLSTTLFRWAASRSRADWSQSFSMLTDRALGGYAKIATVSSADLRQVGQMRPGEIANFVRVSVDDAVAALRSLESTIVESSIVAG
jgi:Carboxyltransferase domain, subdomain A and B